MSLVAPELDYEIKSFAAGFMDAAEPTQLPVGATPNAANAFLFHTGVPTPNEYGTVSRASSTMGKRKGCRLLNPVSMAAGQRVDGLFDFRREGVASGELLAVCNGNLHKWDGGTTFPLLSAIGFVPGSAIEFLTFRNLAFIMDGVTMKAYDGATVFPPGQIAPTAAPAIAAVAPAGAGVTGTYQSLAVWYDSTHDHESSPSAYSVATVFAAQDRQHAKPAGAPAANYDKWRSYVRRTDTNEVYFKLVAETAIGTVTATEAVLDSTRNLATTLLAPLPNQNDVPPTFAFMAQAQGYAFGVKSGDSYVYVSANGDPQSFHPRDKIGVGRGTGGQLTTLKQVGKKIIAQKIGRTYELVGDRMPFIPDDVSGAFGNHSQASSVEAAGWYWCWDEEKGPYKTDLGSSWQSLAEGLITTTVRLVNRTAEIRAAHVKSLSLICWLVATGSSTRTRTLLVYNYLLGTWLPPITGIEYGSITTFQLADGSTNLYIGDQWGRVFQYFVDDVEGVPSGATLTSPVTAATANTVTAAAAAFYTTGDGLKGLPVAVVDSTGEVWQWRIVQSNTGTQITIDTVHGAAWDHVPDGTYTVVVGGINWFWNIPLIDFGKGNVQKRGGFVYGIFASAASSVMIHVRARLNDTGAALSTDDTFTGPAGTGWGSGLWGTMLWGSATRQPAKQRLSRTFFSIQIELSNRFPNQPVEVVSFGVNADPLRSRWASGR